MVHLCFGAKVEKSWIENPWMGFKDLKKYEYDLCKGLLNTSWVGSEQYEWF